jgi:hypothetical protein
MPDNTEKKSTKAWQEIAAEAAKEMDSEKLLLLTTELERALNKTIGGASEPSPNKPTQKKPTVRREKRQPARILSVSYDELLLRTRDALLKREGYEVVSSLGFSDSLEHCKRDNFDLFILGHSIQHSDKQKLVETFRRECPAPIISLRRVDEPPVRGADYHVEPDPSQLLKAVAAVLRGGAPRF